MHHRATSTDGVHFAVLNAPYAITALAIFAIEVLIALFARDAFVRPYGGDVLAVALVYTALRAVTPLGLWPAIIVTLAIALTVELGQLFGIARALGLESNPVARVVLGGSFDLADLAAYSAGALLVVAVEVWQKRRT
jgi:hypothetical protein